MASGTHYTTSDFDEDEFKLNYIEERILVGDGGFIWDDDEDYNV